MSIDYISAEDELFGICNTAFLAAAQVQGLAYSPQLNFPGLITDPPNVTQIYGACSFSVVVEHQSSLACSGGTKQYETVGLLVLQVFSPKSDQTALRIAKMIASSVRDAYCRPSPSGEVWFRDQKVSPVSGSETKNQVNVVITCTYNTVR